MWRPVRWHEVPFAPNAVKLGSRIPKTSGVLEDPKVLRHRLQLGNIAFPESKILNSPGRHGPKAGRRPGKATQRRLDRPTESERAK